jgi:hypothetical protein
MNRAPEIPGADLVLTRSILFAAITLFIKDRPNLKFVLFCYGLDVVNKMGHAVEQFVQSLCRKAPDSVIGFSIDLILPDVLVSTETLTETSIRILPRSKGRPAFKPYNFIAICEPTVQKMWEPQRLTTL